MPKSKYIVTKIASYISNFRFKIRLIKHLEYSHLHLKQHIHGQFLIKKKNELTFQFYEHESMGLNLLFYNLVFRFL